MGQPNLNLSAYCPCNARMVTAAERPDQTRPDWWHCDRTDWHGLAHRWVLDRDAMETGR